LSVFTATSSFFSVSVFFFEKVVFDNSDGRMTVDGDEVVLRRTVGLKKDEFFLNRKRVTKSEVRHRSVSKLVEKGLKRGRVVGA